MEVLPGPTLVAGPGLAGLSLRRPANCVLYLGSAVCMEPTARALGRVRFLLLFDERLNRLTGSGATNARRMLWSGPKDVRPATLELVALIPGPTVHPTNSQLSGFVACLP